MENLTIITLLSLLFLAWIILSLTLSRSDKTTYQSNTIQVNGLNSLNDAADNDLVKNYQYKPNYKNKLVLIIESFTNLEHLLTLLRCILKQEIKVDSIILISSDESLNKVQLIQNTCILNKVGGLSFLLKESGNNTTILFIFPVGFGAFIDPQFLKKFIETDTKNNGLVKVETASVNVTNF